MHTQSVPDEPAAHGSILRRIPVSECRLRGFQKIKVAKHGRRISLLHDAAAGAAGILSLDLAVGFHHNSATTRWMTQCQRSPDFMTMAPFPPFARTAGC